MGRLSTAYDRVRDPHPAVIDVLIVVCLAFVAVITEVAAHPDYRRGNALSITLALVAVVALLWRRTHPVAVVTVAFGVMAVHSLASFPGGGPFFASIFALYSVAAYGSPRAARTSLALVIAVQPLAMLTSRDPNFDTWGDAVVGVLIFTAVWVWGDSRRLRRLQVEMIEERAVRAERERDEQARIAVTEERSRIAREMHDIVAHSVSVMVVQAGAARRLVDRDPAAAAEAAALVEATGREALREMRRVVGVLRSGTGAEPPDRSAALEPQPALSDIPALIDGYREAGLDVRLRVDGEPSWARSGVDLAAYRIVQEALTNTIKHAGPARAEVRLAFERDALTVVVADDGRGPGFEPGRDGHGLVGMRERVAVYGGELEAGPQAEGGYRLRAKLPVVPA